MTDLETRLTEALEHGAGSAPGAVGLADGARTRARRRRRTRVGLTAAAVVVAAVPAVLTVTGGSDPAPDRPPVAVDPTPTPAPGVDEAPAVPEGWRVVRWRDLEVAVPGEWQDGSRSSWCANGGSPEAPRVEVPGEPGFMIDCADPEQSYGVTLGPDASAAHLVHPSGHVWRYDVTEGAPDRVDIYVPNSWLGYWYDDERMVQVNAGDRETVERILASVHRADVVQP